MPRRSAAAYEENLLSVGQKLATDCSDSGRKEDSWVIGFGSGKHPDCQASRWTSCSRCGLTGWISATSGDLNAWHHHFRQTVNWLNVVKEQDCSAAAEPQEDGNMSHRDAVLVYDNRSAGIRSAGAT